MPDATSPATRLSFVVVQNDQTGARWLAPVATIRNGLIVIDSASPPRGFFDDPASTFTIDAADGGGRKRRFPNVTLDREASRPPGEYAFT